MKWNKFLIPCQFTMFTRLSLDLKGGLGKIAGWKPFLVPLVDLWTVAAAVAALTAGAVCKTTWNCERSLRKNLLVHSFALEMEASMDDLASLHGDVIFTVWTNLPGCHQNFWLGLLTIKVWLGECRRTKIMSWSDVEKIRRNKKHV